MSKRIRVLFALLYAVPALTLAQDQHHIYGHRRRERDSAHASRRAGGLHGRFLVGRHGARDHDLGLPVAGATTSAAYTNAYPYTRADPAAHADTNT